MPTLLFKLEGPMQSWGSSSKYDNRYTENFPTKSGVIGLIANALGRDRKDDISDLSQLRFGVRIDRPGTVLCDFHTARGEKTNIYVTRRYYLSDAKFLVGLESENEELLSQIESALKNPSRPLYLGRRSFPLSLPPIGEIYPHNLEKALQFEKLPDPGYREQVLDIWVDGTSQNRDRKIKDLPVSFNPDILRHTDRFIKRLHPVIIPSKEQLAEQLSDFDATEGLPDVS